jgi:NADH dehydrogenase, FAD-containing subunit
VGDCAFVPDVRRPGKSHPPTRNTPFARAGLWRRISRWRSLAVLQSHFPSRPSVARLHRPPDRRGADFRLQLLGFFAWWLWRTIYLSKLPGLDKKVRVAFDWTLDLLFRKDVCAVHDLSSRADFHRRERRRATVGDNGQYQRTAEVEATLEAVNR